MFSALTKFSTSALDSIQ